MAMNPAVIDELDKWSVGPELPNHWVHDDGLSIRATHPHMEAKDLGFHIAPTEGWVVEIYPVEDWPVVTGDYDDIYRWEPSTADEVRRLVAGLMLAVAESEGKT